MEKNAELGIFICRLAGPTNVSAAYILNKAA